MHPKPIQEVLEKEVSEKKNKKKKKHRNENFDEDHTILPFA